MTYRYCILWIFPCALRRRFHCPPNSIWHLAILPLFPHLPLKLPLFIILETEKALVKMMRPHIPILTTTTIAFALGVNGDGIQRSKMTPHTPDLLLKNLVVYPRFEAALSRGRRGYVHGGLAPS